METQFLTELFKYGGLVGVLGYGLFLLWKRYDKFVERSQADLQLLRVESKNEINELRASIMNYMNSDRHKLEEIMQASTDAMIKTGQVMEKANEVTRCLITEMQNFKKGEGEIYEAHLGRLQEAMNNRKTIRHKKQQADKQDA